MSTTENLLEKYKSKIRKLVFQYRVRGIDFKRIEEEKTIKRLRQIEKKLKIGGLQC